MHSSPHHSLLRAMWTLSSCYHHSTFVLYFTSHGFCPNIVTKRTTSLHTHLWHLAFFIQRTGGIRLQVPAGNHNAHSYLMESRKGLWLYDEGTVSFVFLFSCFVFFLLYSWAFYLVDSILRRLDFRFYFRAYLFWSGFRVISSIVVPFFAAMVMGTSLLFVAPIPRHSWSVGYIPGETCTSGFFMAHGQTIFSF